MCYHFTVAFLQQQRLDEYSNDVIYVGGKEGYMHRSYMRRFGFEIFQSEPNFNHFLSGLP